MQNSLKIKFKRVKEGFDDIPLPGYTTEGAAGMDVRAAVAEPFTLTQGAFSMIPTGLAVEIPAGYEIQVRARSGLAVKYGIGVLNGPGTIDEDYRGEINIILFNFSKNDFVINRGERIAQLVISKVYRAEVELSDKLSDTVRGEGGFGSTG